MPTFFGTIAVDSVVNAFDSDKKGKLFGTSKSGMLTQLILQKFIRKVEVGVDSVKVHFIVDEDHFKQELAIKRQSSAVNPSGAISDLNFLEVLVRIL